MLQLVAAVPGTIREQSSEVVLRHNPQIRHGFIEKMPDILETILKVANQTYRGDPGSEY